jgi:hypothetical protein
MWTQWFYTSSATACPAPRRGRSTHVRLAVGSPSLGRHLSAACRPLPDPHHAAADWPTSASPYALLRWGDIGRPSPGTARMWRTRPRHLQMSYTVVINTYSAYRAIILFLAISVDLLTVEYLCAASSTLGKIHELTVYFTLYYRRWKGMESLFDLQYW